MARINSQNRLLIPRELTDLLEISGEVGIFWDDEEKKLYIEKIGDTSGFCICVRNIDAKNRIVIPKSIWDLIEVNQKTELVIGIKNRRIYIFKAETKMGAEV